jgi:hypothetical protein
MSERAGVDTYTVLLAIREMVNKAQVSMINRKTPFHANGSLGTPLISHTDFEVNAWDPLQSFFLDPLSGRPVWMQGNFFGVANALQPKNMLHTIAVPGAVPGALILKDYKLIGIHSGPHTPKAGQPLPPVKVYQMMWMGALLELQAKKKVGVEDGAGTGEQQAIAGLRSMAVETDETAKTPVQADKLEKYVCPNCYTTNTQVGPCFNCGTQITAPEPEEEETTKVPPATAALQKLQEKTNLNQKQLMIIGGVIVALLIVGLPMLFSGGGGGPAPDTNTSTSVSAHPNSEKAMKLAVDNAGFKATAIPGYWYEDTTDLTKPQPSFGMWSEQSNQKIIFVIMDDMAPVRNLTNFVGLPPFCDVYRAEAIETVKQSDGTQVLGDGDFAWFLGRYNLQKPEKGIDTENILIGSFVSPIKGKSILVVGRALDRAKGYDYKTTLWLCDQMAADYTARGNIEKKKNAPANKGEKTEGSETETSTGTEGATEKPVATDEQLDAYVQTIQDAIQGKLKIPDDVQEELKKKHPAKIKAALKVGISDQDGKITKLEIKDQCDFESLTTALQKAVNECAPFKDPPRTKTGTLMVSVSYNKDKLKVERL